MLPKEALWQDSSFQKVNVINTYNTIKITYVITIH